MWRQQQNNISSKLLPPAHLKILNEGSQSVGKPEEEWRTTSSDDQNKLLDTYLGEEVSRVFAETSRGGLNDSGLLKNRGLRENSGACSRELGALRIENSHLREQLRIALDHNSLLKQQLVLQIQKSADAERLSSTAAGVTSICSLKTEKDQLQNENEQLKEELMRKEQQLIEFSLRVNERTQLAIDPKEFRLPLCEAVSSCNWLCESVSSVHQCLLTRSVGSEASLATKLTAISHGNKDNHGNSFPGSEKEILAELVDKLRNLEGQISQLVDCLLFLTEAEKPEFVVGPEVNSGKKAQLREFEHALGESFLSPPNRKTSSRQCEAQ